MAQGKEIAKKRERNWAEYNEQLIRRGEMYINLDFIEKWDEELEQQNKGKKGKPYIYPEAFIRFSAIVHEIFNIPYRQLEGFYRGLARHIDVLKVANYTTLFRRIRRLEIQIPECQQEDMVIAIDSSGIKVTNRGEWLREKWKVHRGWLKVHIAVDIRTKKVVGIEVTDETVGDPRVFKELICQAETKGKVEKVLADGAYDTREIFNILEENGIESGIKIRKNASTRAKGSPYRKNCVREVKTLGYEKWKEKHGYGKRWAVEGVFSSVKRIFGETVRAHGQRTAIQEVKRKFLIYNMLLDV